MQSRDLLLTAFDNVETVVRSALDGIDPALLTARIDPEANTVGWLVWHLTRVQDHHVSELLDADQVWVTGGNAARFGLEPDPHNTGYGHRPEQLDTVRPESPDALVDYYAAVAARTDDLLRSLKPEDLDRIVDRRWDLPVTLGVQLLSILGDDLEHVGQAAYVRGLLNRS